MGEISYDMEVPSSIPASKVFNDLVLKVDTLIPKVLPQAVKSVEILEGDGGVGTIKLVTFGEGSQYKCMKERVDTIDKENFIYSYTVIEGNVLADLFESITHHVKIVPSADGGCIFKTRCIYHTKGDAKVSEEEIKADKEKGTGMFKALEAYLLANPDA